jgi:hypothetical protein
MVSAGVRDGPELLSVDRSWVGVSRMNEVEEIRMRTLLGSSWTMKGH